MKIFEGLGLKIFVLFSMTLSVMLNASDDHNYIIEFREKSFLDRNEVKALKAKL